MYWMWNVFWANWLETSTRRKGNKLSIWI